MVKLLAIVFGAAIISSLVNGHSTDAPASPPPTAEQKAKAKAEVEADTKRYAVAKSVVVVLKKAARDPESLRFESMRVSEDAKIACAEYRARNGFGGMAKEFVIFVDGAARSDATTWNKRCTGLMTDYLYATK